jgi:hypothetical protein
VTVPLAVPHDPRAHDAERIRNAAAQFRSRTEALRGIAANLLHLLGSNGDEFLSSDLRHATKALEWVQSFSERCQRRAAELAELVKLEEVAAGRPPCQCFASEARHGS